MNQKLKYTRPANFYDYYLYKYHLWKLISLSLGNKKKNISFVENLMTTFASMAVINEDYEILVNNEWWFIWF
ncbi:hypothetical protein [Spiroplasma endosymbiont of Aspidapion aeneum]|uniref:hypothetical protein n=1 Tax=Spiroplasma endosymbiont of Aspidapion aeneum TaxID=3066276 RepID=UPI00313DFC5C